MTERLDFWARRKAAVQAEQEAEARAAAREREAADRQALEEKTDDEILAELNLPDPESLEPGDNVQAFMAQAVPDRIRRRALRQLWRLNPVLANVDGLVDYGQDFTDGAMVVENLQTAYQVGKGMLKHVEAMARQSEEENGPAETIPEDMPEDTPEDTPDNALAVLVSGETAQAEPVEDVRDDSGSDRPQTETEIEGTPAPRRRMRFAFEGQEPKPA